MKAGTYQAYSGQRKEQGSSGFLHLTVLDLTGGTFFIVRESGKTLDRYISKKRGIRAVREFRANPESKVVLDWVRTRTERSYTKAAKKSR